MRLDAIGTLFSNSWKRLQERFASAVQIFLAPLILIFISQLLFIRATPVAFVFGGILEFLATVLSIIASVALISMYGKGTSVAASYNTGFKLFWSAIWISILVSLTTLGGLVMLIIPGIMLAIQFCFTSYVLVLEGKRGMGALAESREYVKGYWWAIFGRLLLLLLCLAAGMFILYVPATILFGRIVGEIVYAILLLVFVPFSASYEYEVYENLHRLKPDAAAAAAKAEGGFLKVAIVVGIVGAIFLIVATAVAAVFFPGEFMQWQAQHPGGYESQYGYGYPPTTIGTTTAPGGAAMPSGNKQATISPVSGSVGTWITITGSGFAATNTIFMKGLVAAKDVAPAADGTIGFTVPGTLAPNCNPGQACPDFLLAVTPGDYAVTITNVNGTISAGGFVVTGKPVDLGTPAPAGSL